MRLVGPSGCGKSTRLNIIVGTESHDGGSVLVSPSNQVANATARIGYVFQRPRLLNWMTVDDNVNYALRAHQVPKTEWETHTTKYLETVDLEG